jgi:hypothetical protein
MPDIKKFVALFDIHWGYERRGGHKVPLHDPKAVNVAMKFAHDFKPDYFILGGDALDCGAISHHNKKKPGNIEGLRLLTDAEELYRKVIQPAEKCSKNQVFIVGNHCDWLNDLTIEIPALEGILSVNKLLHLDKWRVIEQGGAYNLGKLTFVHGDTVSGGEHVAKAAVINYERNIRFGHHHTFQTYTKTSPVDQKLAKTGIAVPCLCSKGPKYGEGKPNRWAQGFLYGYVGPGGYFNDSVVIISDSKAIIEGKLYEG